MPPDGHITVSYATGVMDTFTVGNRLSPRRTPCQNYCPLHGNESPFYAILQTHLIRHILEEFFVNYASLVLLVPVTLIRGNKISEIQ